MKLSINKPEILRWISVPMLLFLGLMALGRTRDIHLHDTYFILNIWHIGVFFGLLLALLGSGYWLVEKIKGRLMRILSVIHLVLTLGGMLLMMGLIYLEADNYIVLELLDEQIFLTFVVILVAQLIYIINVIIGIFRR